MRKAVPRKRGEDDQPLERLKVEQPALVGELSKRGHMIVSSDGKFFALVVPDRATGMAVIRALDVITGAVLESIDVKDG